MNRQRRGLTHKKNGRGTVFIYLNSPTPLPLSLCLFLSLCLSLCLSISLSRSLSFFLSFFLSFCLSFCLSFFLSFSPPSPPFFLLFSLLPSVPPSLSFMHTHAFSLTRTRTNQDRFDDRGDKRKTEEDYKQDPSPVVHVRSLHPSVVESDIWDVLERFGKIVNIFMMNRKHQGTAL